MGKFLRWIEHMHSTCHVVMHKTDELEVTGRWKSYGVGGPVHKQIVAGGQAG